MADMHASPIAVASFLVVILLPGCDNFQGFTVENPCSFAVKVAFAHASAAPPDAERWPSAEAVPANGQREITTASAAGVSAMEVQVRAPGHRTIVETISAPDDPQVWRIPGSFCTPNA